MPRPAAPGKTIDLAAFLGDELRTLRLAAGFESQEALAAVIGHSFSTVATAEQGRRPPNDAFLGRWLDACRVTGPHRGLVEQIAVIARSAGGLPPEPGDFQEVEARASHLRMWAPLVIPPVLQTPDYCRALASGTGRDPDTIDSARLALLEREDAPDVDAVLDEHVLDRQIGSPAVVHDALVHLSEAARRPNVRIRILPGEQTAASGLSRRSRSPQWTALTCCWKRASCNG